MNNVGNVENPSSKPISSIPVGKGEAPTEGMRETAPIKVHTVSQEGTHTDTSAPFTASATLNFNPRSFNPYLSYNASWESPILYEPNEQEGPKPHTLLEQRIIIKALVKEMKKGLEEEVSAAEMEIIIDAVLNGKPLTNDKHAALAKKHGTSAKEKIRKEGHLPTTWEPTSTSPKDWTPLPIEPYGEDKKKEINDFYDEAVEHYFNDYITKAQPPLTEAQIALLRQAISTGHVSSEIGNAYLSITKQATEVTQENFGLPLSWAKGTTDRESWKPVNAGIVNPVSAAGEAQTEFIVDNLDKLQKELAAALEKSFGIVPEGMKVHINNYLKAIGEAILMMQEQLTQSQIADAQASTNVSGAKFELLQNKIERGKRTLEQQKKIEAQQAKQRKWGWFFKIFALVVSAVLTVLSAAAVFFTAGAATPLMVASLVVSSALLTYTIFDTAFDVTTTIAKAVDDLLKTTFPDSPLARMLVKIAMVVVIIVVLIIASVAAPGLVASKVIAEVIKQVAIQAAIMTVMSSNVITEIVGEICKAAGLDKSDTMIAQVIMSAVTALTMMAAMALGRGVKPSFSGMKAALVDTWKSVKDNAAFILKTLRETDYKALVVSTIRSVSSFESVQALASELYNIAKTSGPIWVKVAQIGQPVTQGIGLSAGIAGGVLNGALLMESSKMAFALGNEKAEIELLEMMIRLMEQLMRAMQDGMVEAGESWQEAGSFIGDFYAKATQSRIRLMQSSAA